MDSPFFRSQWTQPSCPRSSSKPKVVSIPVHFVRSETSRSASALKIHKLDPELEFDHEVYPLGLLPNAGVVVGVSQRMSFSACTEFPCFEPTPNSSSSNYIALPIQTSSSGTTGQSANKNQISVPKHGTNSSLLEKICDLIKKNPEYFDVVVSIARKTDGQHWLDLFSAARRSTERSSGYAFPVVIAAHPSQPNQIALGMSDGVVYVIEPFDAKLNWGRIVPL